MPILRKAIVGFKDATESGMVVACFARIGVTDHDGDKTLPGFFGKQTVAMLPAHNWQHVTIGKGQTREQGEEALAELKMNLAIPAAKDWHSAIKFDLENGAPIQQWSYGFTLNAGGSANGDGKNYQRLLQPTADGGPGARIHEVSPVLVGAGINTMTLAAKGIKFCDELEGVLGASDNLVKRAQSLAEIRAKEGRGLTAVSCERLGAIKDHLKRVLDTLAGLTTDEEARRLARVELRRYCSRQAGI